jgi:hypothetical protein
MITAATNSTKHNYRTQAVETLLQHRNLSIGLPLQGTRAKVPENGIRVKGVTLCRARAEGMVQNNGRLDYIGVVLSLFLFSLKGL